MGEPDAEWLVGQRGFVRYVICACRLCLNVLFRFMVFYTL